VDATTTQTEQSKLQTAKEESVAQARTVAEKAAEETKHVVSDVTDEVKAQLSEQKSRLSSTIREIGDELDQAAQGTSGTVANLAGQAAETTRQVSRWIDTHEPRDVLAEVENFARQRPVLFLTGAAALGFLVGRVTRNAVAVARDNKSGQTIDLRQGTAYPEAMSPSGSVAPGTSVQASDPHLTGQPVDEALLGQPSGPLQQSGTTPLEEAIETGDVLPGTGTSIGQGRREGGSL
jgi:polyhydroxyalkanoate synthesis regulator phasin